jgi:two-component sensor histidine kinase
MAVALKEGQPIRGAEAVAERPDGTRATFIPYPTPLRDCEGKLVGAVNMLVDITDRKAGEDRLKLLAREVDHRAKNMLAVIQAMVHFTRAETVPDFKAAMDGRVRALAHAHSLLSSSRWEGADLRQLVEEELAPYRRPEAPRALVDGPSLTLAPPAAQAIAMALHELATNAVKYGAFAAPSGYVSIWWLLAADGRLVLRWTEAGGLPVRRPSRRGFGMGVIERTIRDQLHGAVRLDWRAEGLICEIEIPAEAVARQGAVAAE